MLSSLFINKRIDLINTAEQLVIKQPKQQWAFKFRWVLVSSRAKITVVVAVLFAMAVYRGWKGHEEGKIWIGWVVWCGDDHLYVIVWIQCIRVVRDIVGDVRGRGPCAPLSGTIVCFTVNTAWNIISGGLMITHSSSSAVSLVDWLHCCDGAPSISQCARGAAALPLSVRDLALTLCSSLSGCRLCLFFGLFGSWPKA